MEKEEECNIKGAKRRVREHLEGWEVSGAGGWRAAAVWPNVPAV